MKLIFSGKKLWNNTLYEEEENYILFDFFIAYSFMQFRFLLLHGSASVRPGIW